MGTSQNSGQDSAAVRQLFSGIAHSYDRLNHLLSLNVDRWWRWRAAREVPPAGAVLDLCAGTLDLALAVQRARPRTKTAAADFCPEMLELGRHKPGAHKLGLVVADALRLPYRDAAFVAVTCGFGVRNFADLQRGLFEARRVLAPGGRLIVLEFFRPRSALSGWLHRSYVRAVLPGIGRLVSGHPSAYKYLADSIGGFLSVEEFRTALLEAGFDTTRAVALISGVASLVIGEVSR